MRVLATLIVVLALICSDMLSYKASNLDSWRPSPFHKTQINLQQQFICKTSYFGVVIARLYVQNLRHFVSITSEIRSIIWEFWHNFGIIWQNFEHCYCVILWGFGAIKFSLAADAPYYRIGIYNSLKWSLFIWLTVYWNLGTKDLKFIDIWSIFFDRLSRTDNGRCKFLTKPEPGLPVVLVHYNMGYMKYLLVRAV